MAKARPIEGLQAEEPYAAAAAKVVAVRGREVADHSRNVLDTDDIERVHDMRVATRRLRAALEIFEPCFPAGQHEEALREVKEVADALGERRDADVTMAALGRFTDELVASDRPGIASLMAELRAEQAEANARLGAFVQPRRLAALGERLSELVMEAERLGAREPE
jgi:CHAD domain-containing protein